jgi:hypothetical protein
MTIDQLKAAIIAHDHYYEWSDDPVIFAMGAVERGNLIDRLLLLDKVQALAIIRECVPEAARITWIWALSSWPPDRR